MRRPRVIGLLLCLLVWSGLSLGQSLQITLYNKTGYDLDSLRFEKFMVGLLRNDSSVVLRSLGAFTLQGLNPMFRPVAYIQGKAQPHSTAPCGTKSRKVKSGTYAFDILFYEDEHGYRLYWARHEEPKPMHD